MSLISKICPVILGTGALVGLTLSSVKADDLSLTDDAPNSGSVTLDNNDKVTSASSDYLRDLANKKQDDDNGLSNRDSWNMASSRWVFYTDGHNIFNNYKRSHSNYLHFKELHGSYAAVVKAVAIGFTQMPKDGQLLQKVVAELLLPNILLRTIKI